MSLTARAVRDWKTMLRSVLRPWRWTYAQDGLATVHNSDFIAEPQFAEAYDAGLKTGSWGASQIHWRAHVACWAAWVGMQRPGDFVECGVNRGGLAMTVLRYARLHESTRQFFLLDTYAGIDDRYITEAERAQGIRGGGYEPALEAVQRNFAPYASTVRIVQGSVPETLAQVTAKNIAYLSIDMNCVEPEIAAAEHLWDRMSPGAIVLLDDYGWDGHIEQKRAFDAFAAERGTRVLALPTGQGLIAKP